MQVQILGYKGAKDLLKKQPKMKSSNEYFLAVKSNSIRCFGPVGVHICNMMIREASRIHLYVQWFTLYIN